MENKNSFYSKRLVIKPWGYEYVIYNDSNKLAVTFLYIKYGRKTSLHSHPQKNRFYNTRRQSLCSNWYL